MSDRLGTEQFQAEIERLISRYAIESDITIGEIVGTLEVVKSNLLINQKVTEASED